MKQTDAEVQAILEQYKAYIGDLGNFGARYSAVHRLYFYLLGATVAVLGLTGSGQPLGPLRGYVLFVVAVFGVGLCVLWLITTNYYRVSFAAKFKVLRQLEEQLPAKPYTLETDYLALTPDKAGAPAEEPGPRILEWIRRWVKGPRPKILTAIEQFIPVVFAVLIIALAYQAEKQSESLQQTQAAPAKKR